MLFGKKDPSKINTDGVYMFNFNGTNPQGRNQKFCFVFKFFKNGNILRSEEDDNMSPKDIDLDSMRTEDLSEYINKTDYYTVEGNKITIRFYKGEKGTVQYSEYEYEEFIGKILPNGLRLNSSISYYDNLVEDFKEKSFLKNMDFKLVT